MDFDLVKAAWKGMRPIHWIKSGFCLAPLFFSGLFVSWQAWMNLVPLLIAISLLSSAGYLWNDIRNVEEDRCHPRKRHRPVASGNLPVKWAHCVAITCVVIGLSILVLNYSSGLVTWLGLTYLLVTVIYTLSLRELPLLDVLVLSFGFVVRVAAGSFALKLIPSIWLLATTYSFALMLAFGKRRGEVFFINSRQGEIGQTRGALRGYTVPLLDVLIAVSALLTIGSYFGLVVPTGSWWMLLSAAPVMMGASDYLRWAWRSDKIEMPEKLVARSQVLRLSLLVWGGCLVLAQVLPWG